MAHLSDAQIQEIQTLLDRREAELREEVRALKAAQAERASAQGLQVEDAPEHGEERYRTGLEHVDLLRDQEELRDIDQARERLGEGTYGQCIECGSDIPIERLRAQPIASRCVACQTRYEQTHQTTPRYTV